MLPGVPELHFPGVFRYYAVVGVQEAMDVTLAVLEHYIPRYFANATQVYHEHRFTGKLVDWNHNQYRVPVTDETKSLLRRNFTHEYDFYLFCRQRLFRQYLNILSR